MKWLWPSVFPAKNWPQKACPEFETTMTRFHFFCLFLQFSILSSSFSLEVQEDLVNIVTICKGRNHKVSHQRRYIIAFQLFIKKKNLHYTRKLSTDQILLFAMTFPFSGPVIPTKDILQGELEPEEDVDQFDGALRGRGRQPPRPHWWGDPTLGRCNHPKCDWPTSDWGRRVWFWEQQCHIASSLSRCLVKIKSILSLLILADVDQLTRSIDRDLLATMRNLFGWESLCSLSERMCLLDRPGNKTVVVGESDPRRPIYFPDIEPGVELHLPSVGERETSLTSSFLIFLRPHTSRPLLHCTFLPPATATPRPGGCRRPWPRVQVGIRLLRLHVTSWQCWVLFCPITVNLYLR